MGLFDEVEKQAENFAGGEEGKNLIGKAVDEGQSFAEEKTGHKYDNQIEKGGDGLEQQVENRLGNL